jgi:hypothetical protein
VNFEPLTLSDTELAGVTGGMQPNPQAWQPQAQTAIPTGPIIQGLKWVAKGAAWELGQRAAGAAWQQAAEALKNRQSGVVHHGVQPSVPSQPFRTKAEATKCLR